MLYEALLVFAVAFFAGWVFFFASGGKDATAGALRHELQAFLLVALAAYFLWCWLRGGQTLAMRAWRIRLVDLTPARALLRFVYALVFLPTGISIGRSAYKLPSAGRNVVTSRDRLIVSTISRE